MTETLCRACRDYPAHDAFICEQCMDQLHGDLVQVADIAHELEVEITKRSHKGKSVGHGKHDVQPLPYNPAASECADEIRWHLVQLVMITNLGQHHGLPADTIAEMAYWVDERLHSVALRDGAEEAIVGLGKAIRAGWRIIDLAPEKVYIGECYCWEVEPDPEVPGSGRRTKLRAHRSHPDPATGYREERYVQCRQCGERHGVEQRIAETEDQVRDVLLPLRDLAKLSGVKLGTVRRWADRRRIEPRGVDREGVRTYRFGDVLDLREQMPTRRAG